MYTHTTLIANLTPARRILSFWLDVSSSGDLGREMKIRIEAKTALSGGKGVLIGKRISQVYAFHTVVSLFCALSRRCPGAYSTSTA